MPVISDTPPDDVADLKRGLQVVADVLMERFLGDGKDCPVCRRAHLFHAKNF
jgi:hypothetical protein